MSRVFLHNLRDKQSINSKPYSVCARTQFSRSTEDGKCENIELPSKGFQLYLDCFSVYFRSSSASGHTNARDNVDLAFLCSADAVNG